MKCFNHYIAPNKNVDLRVIPGHGDCRECKPDENNRYCIGYRPVQLTIRQYETVRREIQQQE